MTGRTAGGKTRIVAPRAARKDGRGVDLGPCDGTQTNGRRCDRAAVLEIAGRRWCRPCLNRN